MTNSLEWGTRPSRSSELTNIEPPPSLSTDPGEVPEGPVPWKHILVGVVGLSLILTAIAVAIWSY